MFEEFSRLKRKTVSEVHTKYFAFVFPQMNVFYLSLLPQEYYLTSLMRIARKNMAASLSVVSKSLFCDTLANSYQK